MAGAVQHDYHLVNPSPWPLIGSIGAGMTAIGAVAWNHSLPAGTEGGGLFGISGPWLFLAGFAVLLITMAGWWRDVVKESLRGENTAPVVRIGLRYGMILFIASEVMFFAAWFWAFFGAALFPGAGEPILLLDGTQMLNADGLPAYLMNDSRQHITGGMWPPAGVEVLDPWHLPLINTLILLLSGTTITWSHYALTKNDQKGFIAGLTLTIILGIFFTFLQYVEYNEVLLYGFGDNVERMFTYKASLYGGSFFMATGFHGVHVIIGTIFLIVCLFRGLAGHFTPERHFGFEAAAWYWHFVDVVWLFLFASIYVAGNEGWLG
jgi:cytochrome c oxidase subunit III